MKIVHLFVNKIKISVQIYLFLFCNCLQQTLVIIFNFFQHLNTWIPGDITLKSSTLIVIFTEHPIRVHGLICADFMEKSLVFFVDAFHLLKMRVVQI